MNNFFIFRLKLCWIFTTVFIFAVVLTAAVADNAPGALSLEQLKIIALEKSPLAKQIDADFSKKLAESIKINLLPNPELNSELRIPEKSSGGKGDNEVDVSISQPFKLSNFGLRSEVSKLIENAATSEQKAAILELTQSLTLSYVKLWALQQKQIFLEEAKRRAEQKAKAVKEASTKGLLGAGDEKLFVAEARKISAQLIGVDADIATVVAELMRITGFDLKNVRTLKPLIEPPLAVEELIRLGNKSSIGIINRSKLFARVAERHYQLAVRDTFPTLSPRLVYEHKDDQTDSIGVGISIPLPFSDWNQSEKIAQLGELNAARAKADYANSEIFREEISSLNRSFNSSLQQAIIYETEVVLAFQDALKFHERQFETGQGTILQVWQTQRELNNSKEEALEFWVKAFTARAQLSIVIGKEL